MPQSVPFPLKPGRPDVEFKFGAKAAYELERTAGCSHNTLLNRGQEITAIALMTCYALKHADPKMTVDKALDLVNAYIDDDGNIVTLYNALTEAINMSGVYGPKRAKPSDVKEEEGSADPQTAATATT